MIPPLVEAGNFNPGTIQKDIDVLGAGSLIALKQYDIFLEIIAVIRKTMPGIKAILVGDGPERDNLISLAESLELQDTVKMAGELPHGQLLKLMEKTRVFLHPSSYEGFGVVCLEALAASARVVSFVRPIGQDIKNWYITRTKEEMAAKALDILQHREISYESVTVFEKNDIVKQMVDLFLE
jgi:glycosyltransferase involved in cell wall biosynthesis